MLRFLRYLIEAIAAIVGVTVILALLLVWRISTKPVSSNFMTPYIEVGIEGIVPGSKASIAHTLMSWDNVDQSISVQAEGIRINNAAGDTIAAIPALHASLSVFGLLFGQFMPKDLTIDHPQIDIERDAAGGFIFGGMAMGAGGQRQNSEPLRQVFANAFDHLTHTVLMRQLVVTRAVFDVHDDITGKNWSVSMPEITIMRTGLRETNHRFDFGDLEGHIAVEVTQQKGVATLDLHYLYDAHKKQHTLSTVFADLNPAFLAGGRPETLGLGVAAIADMPLTGTVEVALDKNLSLQTATAQIHGDAGQLIDADLWNAPVAVSALDLHAAYDGDAQTLTLSDTALNLGGVMLALDAKGIPATQPGQDMDYTATVRIDNMPVDRYAELCPKPVLPDPRTWLTANLQGGVFTHAEATVKGSLAWNNLANIAVTEGGGKVSVSNVNVTYLDGMPPAQNVTADAVFDLNKMTIHVTGGGVGAIRLQPFSLEITGLTAAGQSIHIPLRFSGPAPEIMALLDHKPLGYARVLGVKPDDIQGAIAGSVTFSFPLLKNLQMKDVDIHASATAADIASAKLIPGVTIDRGDFGLTLDMAGITMQGNADLNKTPFQIAWRQNFAAQSGQPLRRIAVTGALTEKQWHNFGITAFDGTAGAVDVVLNLISPNKRRMLVSGTLDMTPAAVQVDRLDWKKPAGQKAVLTFAATAPVDGNVTVTSIELRGDQAQASGSAVLSPDLSEVLSLTLSSLVVGRTDAALYFTQNGDGTGALSFDIAGASLDVSGLRGGDNPDTDSKDLRPSQYHIKVDKLYTSAVGELDRVAGSAARDQQGWRSIDLRGVAMGDTPLSIALTPQPDGHRTFTIACSDFGKAMEGLGFTDKIKGGKLSVTGHSTAAQPSIIDGHATITDFTIEKLPVLALLLNTLSPFGFSGILTDSTGFSRFEGDFEWQGDTITWNKAHAAGSAVGINIDGKININSGAADLQGTVVPFSIVNNMVNYIPVIGGLITGGKNQGVLAVSYGLQGTLDAPQISVNPVSLLTPGFIRNLFFRTDSADEH